MTNAIGGFGSALAPNKHGSGYSGPDFTRPAQPQEVRPGGNTAPPGRLAIIDRHGRYRGHVGPRATAASMWHFGISGPVRLGEFKKRPAWIEGGKNDSAR